MPAPPEGFDYQACYCEENVHRLCAHPSLSGLTKRVLFISNAERAVALRGQRAGLGDEQVVVWDYHVVLLCLNQARRWEVWDLDTTLGLPVSAEQYVEETFDGIPADSRYAPRFRIIDAGDFVGAFSSDRSHMLLPNGAFSKDPPTWPPILLPGVPSNLQRFIDTESPFVGDIVDREGLLQRLRS